MNIYEDGLAQGRREGAEAVKAILRRLEDLERDRDEWKIQHENLLAMYHAALPKNAQPAQDPDTMTLQEVWDGLGGRPDTRPTRQEIETMMETFLDLWKESVSTPVRWQHPLKIAEAVRDAAEKTIERIGGENAQRFFEGIRCMSVAEIIREVPYEPASKRFGKPAIPDNDPKDVSGQRGVRGDGLSEAEQSLTRQ